MKLKDLEAITIIILLVFTTDRKVVVYWKRTPLSHWKISPYTVIHNRKGIPMLPISAKGKYKGRRTNRILCMEQFNSKNQPNLGSLVMEVD